jgi:heterodisulfide reductase subunit C
MLSTNGVGLSHQLISPLPSTVLSEEGKRLVRFVWRCRTIFNCTSACPRDIEVTHAIGEIRLAIRNGSPEGIIKVEDIHTNG